MLTMTWLIIPNRSSSFARKKVEKLQQPKNNWIGCINKQTKTNILKKGRKKITRASITTKLKNQKPIETKTNWF